MEFKVVTLQRNLDLSKNYTTIDVGALSIGLQAVQDDVAEIEVHGPEGITKLSIPVATAATCQGYTIINRDVGVVLPQEKVRRRFRLDIPAKDGQMEAMLDVRWGDQSMEVLNPARDVAYDFILVRQYEVLNDRPMVYRKQDVLKFGDLRIEIGDRVEEGTRNYKKPRYAEFFIQYKDEEPETWQVKMDGRYYEKHGYRLRVTSYDFYSEWYQAYSISVAYGKPREYSDETLDMYAEGIAAEAHVGHTAALTLSATRLQEAENNPNEGVFKVGDTRNIGKVGIKLLKLNPGSVEIMVLSPQVKKTTVVYGQAFDLGRYEISLVGVHGDKVILRVVEE
jgi:hypothetical protein